MTTTVEAPFGSEMMVKGFILDNQLTDFSFDPVRDGKPVANAPAPGKHPLSAMSPTIVLGPDGKLQARDRLAGRADDHRICRAVPDRDDRRRRSRRNRRRRSRIRAISTGRRFWRRTPRSKRSRRGLTAMGHTVATPVGREERPAHRRARQGRLHRRRRSKARWSRAGRLREGAFYLEAESETAQPPLSMPSSMKLSTVPLLSFP